VFYSSPGVDGNLVHNWCSACFGKSRGAITDKSTKCKFPKNDMDFRLHDGMVSVPMVSCCVCPRWVHQSCVLFNPRLENANEDDFTCPKCLEPKNRHPDETAPGAKELKPDPLGTFLEVRLCSVLYLVSL
jgi:hypothetical protein